VLSTALGPATLAAGSGLLAPDEYPQEHANAGTEELDGAVKDVEPVVTGWR
jgi:hypothetical protein